LRNALGEIFSIGEVSFLSDDYRPADTPGGYFKKRRMFMEYILEVKNLSKDFPGVKALNRVSFGVIKGEVHAVIGENGAGKSTLMKILGGQYLLDNGEIYLRGKPAKITGIQNSINQGISVIYQEFNLIPELTVAENIFLTRMPTRAKILNISQLNKMASELLGKLKINIPPAKIVKDLSVSGQQMVEIAKAVSYNAEILIMDEPTASLGDTEVNQLFSLIGDLKSRGTTILYVSHRLKEIFEISDRITVLRDGRQVVTTKAASMTEEELVRSMVGRDISNYYHTEYEEDVHPTEEKLKVVGFTKHGVFENISFTLNKGEIMGVGGLIGSRREEIVRALFGLERYDSGQILLDGHPVNISSPIAAMNHKISYVTEDRKNAGILPLMDVNDNITISIMRKLCSKLGFYLDIKEERKLRDFYIDYLSIKCASVRQKLFSISGGNQQKVVLARALATECEILILLEPTRGIDVGAKSEIYKLLHMLAAKGIGILMVSSETTELITICDRVIVIYQGNITGELVKKDTTSPAYLNEENLMFCATGKKNLFYKERTVT
jgi:ABC-type sugar transport system ATPase subunit